MADLLYASLFAVTVLALMGLQVWERQKWQKERRELLIAALSKTAPDALLYGRALGAEPTTPTDPEPQKVKIPSLPLGL